MPVLFSCCPQRHSERGNSAIELALIMPLLTVIFLAIAQYGTALYDLASLDGAARAAMAYAIKNSSDIAGITTVAQSAGGDFTNNATVNTSQYCQCSDGSSVSCSGYCYEDAVRKYMQISITANYTPPLNLSSSSEGVSILNINLPNLPSTLTSQTVMRIQ